MTGPPNEEAARVLDTREAAEEEERTEIVDDDEAERNRFGRLQERAGRAGYVLMQVQSGYMLLKGCTSFHSGALDAIAVYLHQREGSQ